MKLYFFLILSLVFISATNKANNQLPPNLNEYLKMFNTIEGWFEKPFVEILVELNSYQREQKMNGSLGEIGVYHGKSFIPLYLLAAKNELVLAVDCFDETQYNIDQSGGAFKYAQFTDNLKKFTDNLDKLRVVKGDSITKKTKDYLTATDGKLFRIFSIDGSHTVHATITDLKNVYDLLLPGGIIIVDDYFNPHWPGVSEGVNIYLQSNKNLKPFFIGFNKVLLTHINFVQKYTEFLKNYRKPIRETNFFDTNVVIY